MAKRALTLDDVLSYRARTIPFEGEWRDFVGQPEAGATWIIWGGSFSGKTRLAVKLQKYFAQFCKVAYNSLEEGMSDSFKKAISEENMMDVKRNFQLWDKLTVEEMKHKLKQKRPVDVVIIDSLQYTGMSYRDYKQLRREFESITFIFISHADGKEPKGEVAKSIRYDASVKIYCEGYEAIPQSRYGGGENFIIWEKGNEDYHEFK